MLLTEEEKNKFIKFCEHQIATNQSLIEQMKKMPVTIDSMIQKKEQENAAYMIVSADMKTSESFTIQ